MKKSATSIKIYILRSTRTDHVDTEQLHEPNPYVYQEMTYILRCSRSDHMYGLGEHIFPKSWKNGERAFPAFRKNKKLLPIGTSFCCLPLTKKCLRHWDFFPTCKSEDYVLIHLCKPKKCLQNWILFSHTCIS